MTANPPSSQSSPSNQASLVDQLERLTRAVEALQLRYAPSPDLSLTLPDCPSAAFAWSPERAALLPVPKVARMPLKLLIGIDLALSQLHENTRRFAVGLPSNNVLLWGARGTGKSSSVKAVHAELSTQGHEIKLIEIQREDLASLASLLHALGQLPQRFILFCDDLSFEHEDDTYKALKAVLDGGVAGRPENVVFYATSNRRHLMSRSMIENESKSGIHPREAEEEKVSLSDRFGLWLGFHRCDQPTYLAMVQGYMAHFGLDSDWDEVRPKALEWAMTRGSRSGRVAWQFIQDLAGQEGKKILL